MSFWLSKIRTLDFFIPARKESNVHMYQNEREAKILLSCSNIYTVVSYFKRIFFLLLQAFHGSNFIGKLWKNSRVQVQYIPSQSTTMLSRHIFHFLHFFFSCLTKGQLISEWLFWCLQFYQKQNKKSLRISALASKKRLNKKNEALYYVT